MNNDQLNGLIALKAVAEKKNFTVAAESLKISPSAISQNIKQLESRLGVALLSRTTRSVSLSEAGEKFLNRANPAIDQILSALNEVSTYGQNPSGTLRINLPRVIYKNCAEPLISSFRNKYPEINVELFFEDQQSEIFERGFDAGIRLSDILAKDVIAIKISGPVKFVTVAAPQYLKKHGIPKHPKDLLQHHCIVSRLGEQRLYERWEFEHKNKEFAVQVKGSLILNDFNYAIDSAMKGHGITYTTKDAVKDEIAANKLKILLADFAPTSTGFYLYYPSSSQVLPKLRAFIDHTRNFLKKSS